ncbi:hypothetical protein HanXRQr2_Chr16g0744611 [Helianthus annuus]|uniref:Uncharacterized protein n=1 Tax=Helianthus annuus TaxID=4232 RepID=A0A9K3DQH2_HELAN|nr:hypothetical protein HanXRQr2_Chr16g0744611 [Helianthus annuus]
MNRRRKVSSATVRDIDGVPEFDERKLSKLQKKMLEIKVDSRA